MMMSLVFAVVAGAAGWQHPGGLITQQTLDEVRQKRDGQAWARAVWDGERRACEAWVDLPEESLRAVFPTKRSNVYHNFSCPDCRVRLTFKPFETAAFTCPVCGKSFAPDTDAGIYPPGDMYHGTMYDGWGCLFYQGAADAAQNIAIIGRSENDAAWLARGRLLLALFASTVRGLSTDHAGEGDSSRILTYRREGDNKILSDLAVAYELLRDGMTPEARAEFEKDVLRRMLDDGMLEPIYKYDHNNVYQWYRTIMQTAVCLEQEDLVDWCFGYGDYTPEKAPEHRSLRRLAEKNFKPDGAYWEMCSGYHLYPLFGFCELAVLSHNLSAMDPQRFPVAEYDCTNSGNFAGKTIKNALEWFVSMAMPDRTMPIVGDSTVPRSGMDDYVTTAEIGYRYYDVQAVGDYAKLRERRSWVGLLYGAPQVEKKETPFTSSCLSSGWVSLRNEWEGNRVWVGLNALIPGGGHQHADRLGLTLYSHGQLLALEKATPYNEAVTRELGTFTPMHTTVTVDKESQKQGEALSPEQTPEISAFYAGAVMKFAEIRADRLYPGVEAYRRAVLLVEDVAVDCFTVRGGKVKDWMVHHAGAAPVLSMPVAPASFEPAAWLYNGTERVMSGAGDADWDCRWQVAGVTSRVTLLGAPGTQVYALETYPVDNAVITEGHPPCQTLCVRRESDGPFVAVWDSWREQPNVVSVTRAGEQALVVKTRKHTYCIQFGGGTTMFADALEIASDGAVALVRDREAAAFAGGTFIGVTAPEGRMRISLNNAGGAEADWSTGIVAADKVCPIQYDTYGGVDHRRNSAMHEVTFSGNLLLQAPRK